MLAGTLAGIEMGLARAGVPYRAGGLQAAIEFLAQDPGVEAVADDLARVGSS